MHELVIDGAQARSQAYTNVDLRFYLEPSGAARAGVRRRFPRITRPELVMMTYRSNPGHRRLSKRRLMNICRLSD